MLRKLRALMASMGAAELDIQPVHELGTWDREETCVLAGWELSL